MIRLAGVKFRKMQRFYIKRLVKNYQIQSITFCHPCPFISFNRRKKLHF